MMMVLMDVPFIAVGSAAIRKSCRRQFHVKSRREGSLPVDGSPAQIDPSDEIDPNRSLQTEMRPVGAAEIEHGPQGKSRQADPRLSLGIQAEMTLLVFASHIGADGKITPPIP